MSEISRRGLLKLFGAAAATTAAGLVVPDVARKFFLPPARGWSLSTEPGLNVGDILTIEGSEGSPSRYIVVLLNGQKFFVPVWS